MNLPTGWICPNGETELAELNGLHAELHCYFANPHRMMVVRFTDSNAGCESAPLFLLLTGVCSIEAQPSWPVDQLNCSRVDEDTILVENKGGAFRINCYALRVFTDEQFRRWLGKDYEFVNPAPQDFEEAMKDSAHV